MVLHILLLILKIIGIVLAAILGILVLLLCILFFVPLRYKAEGSVDGDIKSLSAKLKFHWFLHLLSGEVIYEKGELFWKVRILLKRMTGEAEDVKEEAEEAVEDITEEAVEEALPDVTENEKVKPEISAKPENGSKEKPEKKFEEKKDGKTEENSSKSQTQEKQKKKSIWEKAYEKVISIYNKIKYTFKKICDNIKVFIERKDTCMDFLTDEVHKTAFVKVKNEVFRLLKHLTPKKLMYRVRFGCADPYMTGKILAYLSMLYPFIGNKGTITPEFEEEVYEGEVSVKGHIRVIHFIRLLWNIFWNKETRVTWKHIKNFKF